MSIITAISTAPANVSGTTSGSGRALAAAKQEMQWKWSTPRLILAALAVTMILTLIALSTTFGAISHDRTALDALGSDSEPSVVAAERLQSFLADLAANGANAALTNDAREEAAWIGMGKDSAAITEVITNDANANVKFGESEKAPLRAIRDGMDHYSSLIGEARAYQDSRPDLARSKFIWAAREMMGQVIPQAERLSQANVVPLETAYASYERDAFSTIFAAVGVMAILMGRMLWSMRMLSLRTKRSINPWVAAASAILAVTMVWFALNILQEGRDIRVAKTDAYDSMFALYRAHSTASLANADESLWLLDRTSTRERYAADFKSRMHQLANVNLADPMQMRPISRALSEALTMEQDGASGPASKKTPRFEGFLGAELGNISFGYAERKAATDAFNALVGYAEVDQRIRRLDDSGQTPSAIGLCVGMGEDESNGAFEKLSNAIYAAIKENQAEFDRRIASARHSLDWLPWIAAGALVLAQVLASVGYWLRYQRSGAIGG